MKIPFRREVEINCIVPFWYGRAYYDPMSRVSVCYPIPFNQAVRWFWNLYNWVAFSGEFSWKERALMAEEAVRRTNQSNIELSDKLRDYQMREAYPEFYKDKPKSE